MKRFSRALIGAVVAACSWSLPGEFVLPASAAVRGAEHHADALSISIAPAAVAEAYTGRVYVVLAEGGGDGEPRRHMNDWFRPPYLFSKDVTKLEPGKAIVVDDSWLSYPSSWSQLPKGDYRAQAIIRKSLDTPDPGAGPDDYFSSAVDVKIGENGVSSSAELSVAKQATPRPLRETDRIKLVEMVSPSLTAFHGREYKVRAGVLLPENYSPEKTYPVVYSITGFGGDHKVVQGIGGIVPKEMAGDVIVVVPDPSCHRGHSVFADSANNGPWGEMLVRELIPEIEKRYHGRGAAQRYVTGVSSGGWGSLWLQVAYPEEFAGCWSHCPDPVDFRDFQRTNLYEQGANLYKAPDGARRPLARQGDDVMLWYDEFCKREWVLGPGGQIHSFEAVFSPRGKDGQPETLFDRATGAVNTDVAKTWEKYDIHLVLQRNWSTLGPKLAGKLHIYAGGVDTFYLEGAVKLLKESLASLGSDAEVKIIDGMPHTLYREGNAAMFKTIHDRAGDGGAR